MNKNKMNTMPFIKCGDDDTKRKLIESGFQLIEESNGIATFVNDMTKVMTFDTAKIAYSNILNMDKA